MLLHATQDHPIWQALVVMCVQLNTWDPQIVWICDEGKIGGGVSVFRA